MDVLRAIAIAMLCASVVALPLGGVVALLSALSPSAQRTTAWALHVVEGALALLLLGLCALAAASLVDALGEGVWQLQTARIGSGALRVSRQASPTYFASICVLYVLFCGGCAGLVLGLCRRCFRS